MFKKLGIAAAIVLVAASAMASNFRVADQVYVPAAGHITAGGVTFVTDVFVSNLSTDPVTVTVYYASGQNGTQTPAQATFNLAANERKEFVDFFANMTFTPTVTNAFGQLIFNGCKQGTSCGADTQDANGVSPNFRNISVESRTYSFKSTESVASNSGTNGQLFSGLPWYNYVSQDQAANGLDKVFITGIRNTGVSGAANTSRTNLGVVNASQFSNTEIVFNLYSGSAPGTLVATKTVPLGPLGTFGPTSLTSIFGSITGTNYFVTVNQQNSTATSGAPTGCSADGCAGFFAYGSLLDNTTQDATTLESQYLLPLTDAQINCIYPAAGTTPCKGTAPIHRSSKH